MRFPVPWRRRESDLPAERSLVGEFRREFDDLVNHFFGEESWPLERTFGRGFAPAFDVSETENEIVVKAELAGVDPKEVDVSLSANVVTINGEKKEEREEKGESLHRVERVFGRFSRSFTLPCEVHEDKIEATYKNGVLNLKLPKAQATKKKSIRIEVK